MTTFRLATHADDALLRALLRQNAMRTWVDMTVEREPSFFAGKGLFGREWAVLAHEGADLVGMYTACVLPVHVDRRPEELGYLGGLRVNAPHRRRIRHLREGYASIEGLAPVRPTRPWWFTVVAADNHAARRLLEGGVRGLPAYSPVGDYVVFAIAATRGRRRNLWRRAQDSDLDALIAFHNQRAARFQFAPRLDERAVRGIGVRNFLVHESSARLAGVAALWDQRAYKQVVARRYRAPVGALVPAYNLYARLARRIPLPREGRALEQTFIAFLQIADEDLAGAPALMRDLLSHCPTPVASIGLAAMHPLAPVIEALKPMPYPARVYTVAYGAPPTLEGLPAQPEAALL